MIVQLIQVKIDLLCIGMGQNIQIVILIPFKINFFHNHFYLTFF